MSIASVDPNVGVSQFEDLDLQKDYDDYEKFRADFEKNLNLWGYFPVVSAASGSIRVLTFDILSIVDAVSIVFALFDNRSSAKDRGMKIVKNVTYIIHDMFNSARGVIESMSFFIPLAGVPIVTLSQSIFNGIAFFVYDGCDLRLRYSIEKI